MRRLGGLESHTGEAYYARFVDVPLLVTQEFAASLRDGFEERIDGSGTAPLQVVMIFLH
jgi:hypothetical protein